MRGILNKSLRDFLEWAPPRLLINKIDKAFTRCKRGLLHSPGQARSAPPWVENLNKKMKRCKREAFSYVSTAHKYFENHYHHV